MKHVSLLEKLAAVLKKDALSSMRYSTSFLFRGIVLLVELGGIYFLAKAIGSGYKPEGMEFYSYLLIGTAFLDLTVASIASFVQNTMEAQVSGTFEVVMSTSTPGSTVLFLSVASTILGRLTHTFLYLLLGTLLFPTQLRAPDPLAVVVVGAVALVLVASAGMLAAALQVVTLRGAALVWLISVTAGFFSGVMFPIETLPSPLVDIARLNPFAITLDALRSIFVQGASISEIPRLVPLLITATISAVLGPWAFSRALQHARLRGTLAQY